MQPDRSIHAFWNQYGERSGFENKEQFESFCTEAEHRYGDLEVHNFGHAAEVLWKAMELADLCEAHDKNVNRKALIAASIFHDAGYHEDYKAMGYSFAEEYAADLFEAAALRHDFSPEDIDEGQRLISVTKAGTKVLTLNEQIMVRADIDNVGTDEFQARTEALAREAKAQKHAKHQIYLWDQVRNGNIRALGSYLANDLSLDGIDPAWQRRAILNFKKLIDQTAEKSGQNSATYTQSLGHIAAWEMYGVGRKYAADEETPVD